MPRHARESDPTAGSIVRTSSTDVGCRLGLHLGPNGFTLVVQGRCPPAETEDAPEDDLGLSLARGIRKLRDTFAGLLQENDDLRDENRRLRRALTDCVDACGRLVDHTADDSLLEGHEAEHAHAWLALDDARRLLRQAPPGRLLENKP